jgi:RNA polymerase sigma-70 factor (ECF subfamily)
MMKECKLIAAARLGDQDAFTRLHQLHVGYVRGVIRSITRCDEVDDLCQDTFLLAFTRLDSFEGTAQFRTWLTRIAVNRCLVYLRRRGCKSQVVQIDAAGSDMFATHDAQLGAVGARMDLAKLLEQLRPAQRRVLEMAYLEDMPDQDIAEALNTTLFAVKSKIYQAKRRIRKATKKN